jgi:hypothetical protein
MIEKKAIDYRAMEIDRFLLPVILMIDKVLPTTECR